MLANGLFMTKLTYLIALWGGFGSGLMRFLQTLQNKVATDQGSDQVGLVNSY